jgi:transcriptional regulator
MLEQAHYAATRAQVRELVAARGWATIVTGTPVPVVSHLPVVLLPEDPARPDELTVLAHLARADAELHELGRHDVVLVVEGPEGYISPSWYETDTFVPTWNFVVAHLHGRPELLGPEETWDVLVRTVQKFEAERPVPWRLDTVTEFARSIAPYTSGFRLTATRVAGKAKLSQDKPAEVVERVIAALDVDAVHGNPALARAMREITTPQLIEGRHS